MSDLSVFSDLALLSVPCVLVVLSVLMTMMTKTNMMTISTIMTSVFVKMMEAVVYKQVGGCPTRCVRVAASITLFLCYPANWQSISQWVPGEENRYRASRADKKPKLCKKTFKVLSSNSDIGIDFVIVDRLHRCRAAVCSRLRGKGKSIKDSNVWVAVLCRNATAIRNRYSILDIQLLASAKEKIKMGKLRSCGGQCSGAVHLLRFSFFLQTVH